LENSLIKEKAQKKEFLASAGNSFFIDDVPERVCLTCCYYKFYLMTRIKIPPRYFRQKKTHSLPI